MNRPDSTAPAPARQPPPRRVGIFGGTFDPPHNAHVELARTALVALALDEVRWVPSGEPWQKAGRVSPAAQRVAMVQYAMAGEARFKLDLCEIEREGPSFTLDTVRAMQAADSHPPGAATSAPTEWVLIIGQDQYAGLHSWRGWQSLLGLVSLAVGQRPGAAASVHPEVRAHTVQAVPLPMLNISSTDIRQRVQRGEPITTLVPPLVARYIEQHHLYREGLGH